MTKVHVISDFNAELLGRFLAADRGEPLCEVCTAPYGQVFQSLAADYPDGAAATALVWTRPEAVAPEYLGLLEGQAIDADRLLAQVDAFASLIAASAAKFRTVLVASWVSSHGDRGVGMVDWTAQGHVYWLTRMNLRLAEALSEAKTSFVMDSQRWLEAGRSTRDARYWYSMKSPFTEAVFLAAARDVKAALRGVAGLARKLIVLDLDNTLWGGIVGDDGWQSLRIGGHDPIGEAFADFQRSLKTLSRRGVALALVSKNDEATALEAIDRHPEMLLRREDFAAWKINWGDKAQNIVAVTQALNLGLQSVVFIDDNPTERGRIREALPDVLTPEWPKDPTRYADALRQLDCFDQPSMTAEDRARAKMYAQDRARSETLIVASSMDDWLASLGIRVEVAAVCDANLKRSVQLANKTNQMNLQTRRFTEVEMLQWLSEDPDRAAVSVTVADRFGDLGLTGLVSWRRTGDHLEIVDYLLSCRAMGRQVETLMACLAVEAARDAGLGSVIARLQQTERNKPCLDFWRSSGFAEPEPNVFVWDAAEPYIRPAFITVETDGARDKALT